MNLTNEISTPISTVQPTSTSSGDVSSPSQMDQQVGPQVEAEALLTGLCPRELSTLSDSELREWTNRIRTLRTSSQTFRAALVAEVAAPQVQKVDSKQKEMLSDYLNL